MSEGANVVGSGTEQARVLRLVLRGRQDGQHRREGLGCASSIRGRAPPWRESPRPARRGCAGRRSGPGARPSAPPHHVLGPRRRRKACRAGASLQGAGEREAIGQASSAPAPARRGWRIVRRRASPRFFSHSSMERPICSACARSSRDSRVASTQSLSARTRSSVAIAPGRDRRRQQRQFAAAEHQLQLIPASARRSASSCPRARSTAASRPSGITEAAHRQRRREASHISCSRCGGRASCPVVVVARESMAWAWCGRDHARGHGRDCPWSAHARGVVYPGQRARRVGAGLEG